MQGKLGTRLISILQYGLSFDKISLVANNEY